MFNCFSIVLGGLEEEEEEGETADKAGHCRSHQATRLYCLFLQLISLCLSLLPSGAGFRFVPAVVSLCPSPLGDPPNRCLIYFFTVFMLERPYLALCITLSNPRPLNLGCFQHWITAKIQTNLMPVRWVSSRTWLVFCREETTWLSTLTGNSSLNFQERVQQLEEQLREMEKEKERELSALRKEKRELVHTTQMVGHWLRSMQFLEYNWGYREVNKANRACLLHKKSI